MSTYSEVLEDIANVTQSILASDWSYLPYVFSIEKNSCRGNFKRYAVVPSEMTNVNTLPNHLTVAHSFQIILANSFINPSYSDEGLRNILAGLYEVVDDIVISVTSRNTQYQTEIYSVNYVGTDLPEVYDEHNVVVLRINLSVEYKKNLN